MELAEPFRGFAIETNILIRACLDSGADLIVVLGDDLHPDPKFHAQEIADRFVNQFPDLEGVAQPLGDKYGAALARLREPRVRLSDHRP